MGGLDAGKAVLRFLRLESPISVRKAGFPPRAVKVSVFFLLLPAIDRILPTCSPWQGQRTAERIPLTLGATFGYNLYCDGQG